MKAICVAMLICACPAWGGQPQGVPALVRYRAELEAFRQEYGGVRESVPHRSYGTDSERLIGNVDEDFVTSNPQEGGVTTSAEAGLSPACIWR